MGATIMSEAASLQGFLSLSSDDDGDLLTFFLLLSPMDSWKMVRDDGTHTLRACSNSSGGDLSQVVVVLFRRHPP
jgi:hypothetical protein